MLLLHSTKMVDEFNAGIALAIATMASPVLVYFVLAGLPSTATASQISGRLESQIEGLGVQIQDGDLDYLNDINFKNSNPEERLRIAYERSAQVEVNRCLGDSQNKEMCKDTMALLVDSCTDSSMYVAACDDPRLANYRTTNLKN